MHSDDMLVLSETETVRFWQKVDKSPHPKGCWEWTGSKDMKGYGKVWKSKKLVTATRISLRMKLGHPFPADTPFACHHCDNPGCVNPDHLYLGHFKSNAIDSVTRGRWNGAKWSKSNGEKISELLKEHIKKNPDWVIRGEAKVLAKLTEAKIRSIRSESMAGIGARPLAAKYGVSRTLIRMVVSRKIWTHVH